MISNTFNFCEKNQPILFYDVVDEYFEFSNFYPRKIKIHNIEWPTTEHYYQAQKFKYKHDKEKIRTASSPDEAFLLGQNLKANRIEDWHLIKVAVMRQAIYAKFSTQIDLKTILINTQQRLIQENSAVDSFWGIGVNGQGKNMLGILLMELRQQLSK